jgi:hypothetical protein
MLMHMTRTRLRVLASLLIAGGLALALGSWLLASSSDSGWNPTFIGFAAVGLLSTLMGIGTLARSRTR